MGKMRKCAAIQAWLSASLDGETRGRWRRAVEQHLAECPRCRALEQHLLRLKEVLGRQGEVEIALPVGLWDRVEHGLEQVDGSSAPVVGIWVRRSFAPAMAAVVVLVALFGLGVFRRGAVLSAGALAAEFPKQGGLLSLPIQGTDLEAVGAQMSRLVRFEVSPPDLSRCGFLLVGAGLTEVGGITGVSFVYRRGCEVVVVSQLGVVPRLEGFEPATGKGEQRIHQATFRDLKLVVWREGNRLSSLSCSRQVFLGPMGQMRCR